MKTLIRGGRVCDPATGFDGVTDVLVDHGTVSVIGVGLDPTGATVVDATGLIVGPGFIDLHSHMHSVVGHRLQAFDGVTTAFELEAGLSPVERAYREAAATGRPLNYGFSASWAGARSEAMLGLVPQANFSETMTIMAREDWQRSTTRTERATLLAILERELADGALGVGVLLGYAPESDPREFLEVARLAARAGAPTFTHVRELVEFEPSTPIDGPSEIAIAAAETGGAMHHCHVNSTSLRHVDRVLAMLDRARSDGARVSVEAYPWGAGATSIGAYFLAPERLARHDMKPSNIMLIATGERIADEARLREVRATAPGALCIPTFLHEDDPADFRLLQEAFIFPDSIPASDSFSPTWADGGLYDVDDWPIPPGGTTHPRGGGTFTKTIRMMVRDTTAWTWLEAFRRCSYLPARMLDEVAPAMRAKGHLGVGADADIVILDPSTVSETATYADSTRLAEGVRHLLVNGSFLIRDGALDPDSRPGRGIRGVLA
jgi:hypothetical protein